MNKVLKHILLALVLTGIGTAIWLYRENVIFPNEPIEYEFKRQIHSSDSVFSSEEMKEDFDYLLNVLETVHPNPYITYDEEQWEQMKKSIYSKLDEELSASEFYFLINDLVVSIQDAHTSLNFNMTHETLPIEFEWVKEGLVIKNDFGDFKKGDLVLKIGEKNTEEILKEMDKIISSENIYRVKSLSEFYLRTKFYLDHLNISESNNVKLLIKRDNNEIELTSIYQLNKSRNDIYRILLFDWKGWYIDEKNNYGLFYLKVCQNNEEYKKSLEDFFYEIRNNNIENVVLDVRENIGGSSSVINTFMNYTSINNYKSFGSITKFSELAADRLGLRRKRGTREYSPSNVKLNNVENPFDGNLYVFTANMTYSSGNWFAVIIHDNNLGKVIGEPTGNAPTSFGDVLSFQLPNSRFILSSSYKKWIRPNQSHDPINSLYPHIIVEKTREDIINNTDPVKKYFIEMINSK